MKIIDRCGTLELIDLGGGMYKCRCPKCLPDGTPPMNEVVKNIYWACIEAVKGGHNGCKTQPEKAAMPVPEFVCHLTCQHWLAGVDTSGGGNIPGKGEMVNCIICGEHRDIVLGHALGAPCEIGGCDKMEIALPVMVDSDVTLSSRGFKA